MLSTALRVTDNNFLFFDEMTQETGIGSQLGHT